MKKVKKYILYMLLVSAVIAVSFTSFIRERNRILKNISEKTETYYAPVAVISTPAPEDKKDDTVAMEGNEIFDAELGEVSNSDTKTIETEETEETGFILPVGGVAITPFSDDTLVYSETMHDFRTHNGIDFDADEGENVFAVYSGNISDICEDPLLGHTVTIDHGNGLETIYSSLDKIVVNIGDEVSTGEIIGICGESAKSEAKLSCHLHFEAKRDGERINPEELFQ